MYFVYVLISLRDRKFYMGFTTDVEKRIQKHHEGGAQSTQHRRPLQLIFYEMYLNKSDALRREQYFKTNPGKKTLKMMLRNTLKENVPNA